MLATGVKATAYLDAQVPNGFVILEILRGLAAVLRQRLAAENLQYGETIKNLRIKISGCFNSCGQHHLAEIVV